MSSLDREIIDNFVETNIFDVVMDTKRCDNVIGTKCLNEVCKELHTDPHFVLYFNNDEKNITASKKFIFWSVLCHEYFTTRWFYKYFYTIYSVNPNN